MYIHIYSYTDPTGKILDVVPVLWGTTTHIRMYLYIYICVYMSIRINVYTHLQVHRSKWQNTGCGADTSGHDQVGYTNSSL